MTPSREFMREIGKKGGLATKKNRGLAHFSKVGKKGGRVTKKMWETENARRKGEAGSTG